MCCWTPSTRWKWRTRRSFSNQILKEDLLKLINNLEDLEDDETFADATDPVITHKRALPPGAMYAPGEAVPEKRLNMKGTVRMKKRASSPSGEAQASRPNPGNSVTEVDEALVVEKRVPRSIIKQNDKEIKWEDIPPIERELYHEAEAKQWKEHLHYEAVRVHPPEDAALLRQKVPRERILRARFAYRDKNAAKRRENPDTPPKAKARLCIGGHLDPDLQKGQVKTEAPTASKMAFHTVLFLAAQLGWRLAAGDVEAAFLNGVESRRGLYFEPPRRGLPGVEEGSLIEIIKGVFGLSNSPRLWWQKLASELLELVIKVGDEELRLHHHEYDPCLFLLRAGDGGLRGALMCHVDDLLIAAGDRELEASQRLQDWKKSIEIDFFTRDWFFEKKQ